MEFWLHYHNIKFINLQLICIVIYGWQSISTSATIVFLCSVFSPMLNGYSFSDFSLASAVNRVSSVRVCYFVKFLYTGNYPDTFYFYYYFSVHEVVLILNWNVMIIKKKCFLYVQFHILILKMMIDIGLEIGAHMVIACNKDSTLNCL